MQISTVYDNCFRYCGKQAAIVAEGFYDLPGVQAKLIAVAADDIGRSALEASNAIVFGSPSRDALHHGGASLRTAQYLAFYTYWPIVLGAADTVASFLNGPPSSCGAPKTDAHLRF